MKIDFKMGGWGGGGGGGGGGYVHLDLSIRSNIFYVMAQVSFVKNTLTNNFMLSNV